MCNKSISFFLLILFIAFSVLPINLSHAGKRSQGISSRGDPITSDTIPTCDMLYGGSTVLYLTDDTLRMSPSTFRKMVLTSNLEAKNCKNFPPNVDYNICTFVQPSWSSYPENGKFEMETKTDTGQTYKIPFNLSYYNSSLSTDQPTIMPGSTGNNTFPFPSGSTTAKFYLIFWWPDLDDLLRQMGYSLLPVGTYMGSFRMTSYIVKASENPVGGTCSPKAGSSREIQYADYSVILDITPKCYFYDYNMNLDFGQTPTLNKKLETSTTFRISCNSMEAKLVPFTLGFDMGRNEENGQRQMTQGQGSPAKIPYNLFFEKDGKRIPLIKDQSVIAMPGHMGLKQFNVIGQVPAQPGKKIYAGGYDDVVVITLTY